MPAKLEELTAIYQIEKQRWGDTVIIECRHTDTGSRLFDLRDNITIKTNAEEGDLEPWLSYRFYGRWEVHPKWGKQFIAKTWVRCAPHGQAGVTRYLMQAPNIGHAHASALWEKFGSDAVRILREQPDVAAAAVGGQLTEEKAREAAAHLEREKGLEDCSIEMVNLLGGRGFPRDTAKKAVQEYGNRAHELIQANPYLLMRFRGCGFGRCDQMYLDLGGNPDRLKRQSLCAWYALARDTEGHTWHPKKVIRDGLRGKISARSIRAPRAVKLGHRARMIDVHKDDEGGLWFADSRKAAAERKVAQIVAEALQEPAHWPAISSLDVSDHQAEQLYNALQGTIGILAGSPGTGKTYTAARLAAKLVKHFGADSIAIAAPTGKAAVRVTEALREYGVPLEAKTIHRLLRVASRSEGEGWGFEHHERNPLPYRVILVDESSMIGTDLMASLLRARTRGTHILFIGDTNQLLPVGHGAPLRDFITAGVPTGELRKIRRNAGSIVRVCAAIRDGESWEPDLRLNPGRGENLRLLDAKGAARQTEAMLEFLSWGKGRGLFDPVWDVQLIVAVNKKSDLSRQALNKLLQRELNPSGYGEVGTPFRVGDKIVCLKNGFMPADDENECEEDDEDGKVFVANGEIGSVLQVEEKLTVARFHTPDRVVRIPRGKPDPKGKRRDDEDEEDVTADTGCAFDLAYAVSCHKAQGSEFPIVPVVLDEYMGARRICTREWLYTAISRAKWAGLLVGQKSTAMTMCRRRAITKRKTFLRELLEEAIRT